MHLVNMENIKKRLVVHDPTAFFTDMKFNNIVAHGVFAHALDINTLKEKVRSCAAHPRHQRTCSFV